MLPADTPDTASAELRALKSELNEWMLGIRCVFAALNVLPLYYCTRILLMAPKFHSVFADMLGSTDKLPPLTRWVIEWSIPLLGGIWLLAGLAIAFIFIAQKARHVWLTTLFSAFTLIAAGHLVATVLMDPLIKVVQDISGASV